MKTLECAQLSEAPSDCSFVAEGETNEEVIGKIYAHAGEVHKDKIEGMSEKDNENIKKTMNELLDKQEDKE